MSILTWFFIWLIILILLNLTISYDISYFLFFISYILFIIYYLGAGEELLGQSEKVDASGNRKLPAIGVRTHVPYALSTCYSDMYISLIR